MPAPDSVSPLPLLIVDDEPSVLGALKVVLERDGHAVVTCADPHRALELVEDQAFSVIISDHRMPAMTGLEFLVECRERQPHATRILITAVLSLPTIVEAINRGEIFRFVAKPWLREELAATVRNAVNRHELIVQNERLQAETQRLNTRLSETNEALAARVAELAQRQEALDRLNRELTSSYDRSLEMSSRILAIYDPHLAGQTRALVEIAQRMAAAECFRPEERETLRTSAWLCDLGLIGVSRELLRAFRATPDQLTPRERHVIHSHPVYSQTLAAYIDARPAVGETVRAHHERFDGGGFPDGVAGQAIPWPARCLAVAVWFVESGLSKNEAIEHVVAQSGHALDPEAVRLFLKVTHLLQLPRQVREVMLDDLLPGMVLANGIYSPHGLLLVGEGQALSAGTIGKIRNHNLASPISQRLFVYT